jgi:hypothetical protein
MIWPPGKWEGRPVIAITEPAETVASKNDGREDNVAFPVPQPCRLIRQIGGRHG